MCRAAKPLYIEPRISSGNTVDRRDTADKGFLQKAEDNHAPTTIHRQDGIDRPLLVLEPIGRSSGTALLASDIAGPKMLQNDAAGIV